ncbi:hypothetical protein [Geodermatophilus sp. SYSU D00815]
MLIDWSLERPVTPPRLPVAWLSEEQTAAELQRVQQRRAREAAYEAELVPRLAALTPDDADPAPGTPGARSRTWRQSEPEFPACPDPPPTSWARSSAWAGAPPRTGPAGR